MYQFEWHHYQHPFKRPLKTHHGTWSIREGLLVKLTAPSGAVAWGEIAPLPWFGSETLPAAIDFCKSLPPDLTASDLLSITDDLPACQFGLGSAAETLGCSPLPPQVNASQPLNFCGLLPAGHDAISTWPILWNQGFRTFKWKIGVQPLAQELEQFHILLSQLPATAQLRLDANGGLDPSTTKQWLQACDASSTATIEYLEQPLPPHNLAKMLQLQTQYQTPLALDESVASLAQLQHCIQQGWQGIFVIKAAILGYPHQLRQMFQTHPMDLVFSSVFETEVGRQACLKLAQEFQSSKGNNPTIEHRALGFGVEHWV